MKEQVKLGQLPNLFPMPVVLVSAKSGAQENLLAIAWCGIVCSEPPTVAVSVRPSRFTSQLIKNSGEFVINIPSEKLLDEIDKAGSISGAETDKFELLKLRKENSDVVSAPSISECLVSLECKVKQTLSLGSHDCFVAEIVAARAEKRIISKDKIDFFKLKPLVLLGPEYWNLGEKIEEYGFTKKK